MRQQQQQRGNDLERLLMTLVDADASVHDVPRSGLQWDDQRRLTYLIDRGPAHPLAWCRVGHPRRWPRTRRPIRHYGGSQGVHGRKSGDRPPYVLHRSVLVPPSRLVGTLTRPVHELILSDPPYFPILAHHPVIAGASGALTSDAIMTPFDGKQNLIFFGLRM